MIGCLSSRDLSLRGRPGGNVLYSIAENKLFKHERFHDITIHINYLHDLHNLFMTVCFYLNMFTVVFLLRRE